MTDPKPRWDLLPKDPIAFFELEPPFDRKDLKRKYNRLIKVYKPEKSPNEFKQIRAAYEVLEQMLKQDQDGEAELFTAPVFVDSSFFANQQSTKGYTEAEVPPVAGEVPHQPAPEESATDSEAPAPPVKAAHESLDDVLAKAIAFEAHHGADPLLFLEHILKGMYNFPKNKHLMGLVSTFVGLKWDEGTLMQIFSLVLRYQPQHFYELTLEGWHHLATLIGYPQWQQKVDQVEEKLMLQYPAQTCEFYQNLLYYHWSGVESTWLREKLTIAEDLSSHADDAQQFHLDILSALSEYRQVAAELYHAHPILAYIHDSVVAYCRDFSETGARQFQEMHRELLNQGSQYMEAFSHASGQFSTLFRVVNMLSLIAMNDLEIETVEREPKVRFLTFEAHMQRALRNLRGTGTYWKKVMLFAVIAPMFLVLLLTLGSSLLLPALSGLEPGYQAGIMLAMMAALFIGFSKLSGKFQANFNQRVTANLYEQYWRYELIDFIYENHIGIHELKDLVALEENEVGLLPLGVSERMRGDWALWFYSLSIMFV